MKLNKFSAVAVAGLLALPAAAPVAMAGGQSDGHSAPKMFNMAVAGPGQDGDRVMFVSTEFAFDGEQVKNAPYSAEAVTETTQTLGDGNKITRRSTTAVYRDSEGRTRREMTLGGVGFWTPKEGGEQKAIIISDPVEGVHYILEQDAKIARKMPLPKIFMRKADGDGKVLMRKSDGDTKVWTTKVDGEGEKSETAVVVTATASSTGGVHTIDVKGADKDNVEAIVTTGEGDHIVIAPRSGGMAIGGPGLRVATSDKVNAKEESLGKSVIEGVEADGTRVTVTIPAGEIGNERAIDIVTEQWVSKALGTVVMSRHSDPRFGETVFKLTNINRSEPNKSLFEVPADYKIEDPGPGRFKIERKMVSKPAEKKSEQ